MSTNRRARLQPCRKRATSDHVRA